MTAFVLLPRGACMWQQLWGAFATRGVWAGLLSSREGLVLVPVPGACGVVECGV